jgi:GDP-4-dehydro-6-deoxy-D-mannose reductase
VRGLVTGAGGFVGQWLCSELLRDGWDVHGATLTGAPAGGTLQEWQRDAVFWHDVDLRDNGDVADVLDESRPDAVFHLAGVASAAAADADPDAAWATNVHATAALIGEVVKRRAAGTLDPVVLVVGSGEQYGPHDASEMPLAEDAEQRPATVYARSKAAQEAEALKAWSETGTRIIATRSFNHSGPGQPTTFLLPALVARTQEAFAQRRGTIPIGNTTPVRDFLHVEDVARAYIYLVLRGVPGEVYNVCSGTGTSVGELTTKVIAAVTDSYRFGLNDAEPQLDVRAVTDPSLVRDADVPVLVGDPGKLKRATTWEPKHTIDMLIDDLVYAEEI